MFICHFVSSDSATCEAESSSAVVQSGWPLASDIGAISSICWRRRRLVFGGSYSPWRFVQGGSVQAFVPALRGTRGPVQPAAEPEKLAQS